MSQVTKEDLSSLTTATAYIEKVKLITPTQVARKKQRSFFVVKLAMHNGKRPDGKLSYIYPECGVSDELVDLVTQLAEQLEANPDDRLVARVEIANLRGQPWFEDQKSGVNYRGTLRGITLAHDGDDAQ